jgi:hypothetical protein
MDCTDGLDWDHLTAVKRWSPESAAMSYAHGHRRKYRRSVQIVFITNPVSRKDSLSVSGRGRSLLKPNVAVVLILDIQRQNSSVYQLYYVRYQL